ncbi:MAG: DNA-processing protein DprA [Victivallales bacterium]|nr:DNA-processing protein DprA [Victivallales bacterium]
MLDHRTALLVLNMLPGIGPGRTRFLLETFGSPEAALAAPFEELCRVHGIGEKLAPIICQWPRYCNPDAELRLAQAAGVTIVQPQDDAYPPLLRNIHDPPLCLYVRGKLAALRQTEMAIAIVGSRAATNYGRKIAAMLAEGASMAGWPVVSGLARGIDTAAHEATLRFGGVTLAVIGSGLSAIYPKENLGLAAAIAERGGAVLSEFPMRYQPDKRSFPMRNRIISGICQGTIVVEAGVKSGSLITAAQALEQGRTVFAVPGMVDAPFARGCHALIRDGATLVESFQDVINEFTLLPGLAPPEQSQAHPLPPPNPAELGLTGLEAQLWQLLGQGYTTIDGLIDATGNDPSCIMAALVTLELRRLIRRTPGSRIEIGGR